MGSHLLLMAVFAFFVSVVFALLARDDTAEQLRFGAFLFGGFIIAAVVMGWLMYPFPIG
jgi:hypothetical protein